MAISLADLDGLNTEQLAVRIAQEEAEQQTLDGRISEAVDEIQSANERQRLRRQLEVRMNTTRQRQNRLRALNNQVELIDGDHYGEHMPGADRVPPPHKQMPVRHDRTAALHKEKVTYDTTVVEDEFTWEIGGLSWLPFVLKQEQRECTDSSDIIVDHDDDDSRYKLVFSPHAGSLVANEDEEDFTKFEHDAARGTLVLIRKAARHGTNLDIRFFVRDPTSGDFSQWGADRRVAVDPVPYAHEMRCFLFGPDLEGEAKGVFGLSFEALLQSKWVRNDTITFKVAVKEMVMKDHPDSEPVRVGEWDYVVEAAPPQVRVPDATLGADLLAMLRQGSHSDVTVCAAYGDAAPVRFAAHASLLATRSPVFRAALDAGMQESATRVITVVDTPPCVLRALLAFLYTDDFEQVRAALKEDADAGAPRDLRPAHPAPHAPLANEQRQEQRMAQLQSVLAAAHKYEVTRLVRWCEQQLCEQISGETVCSLLGLAHLYDATALEQSCLKFIKANMKEVLVRPEYAALPPALLVKVQLHCAGVEPAESRKRKRSSDAE